MSAEADARAAAAGAAHEQQRAARAHLAARRSGRRASVSQQVLVDVAARLVEVHLGQRRVVRAGRPVTITWSIGAGELVEEPLEPVEVGGVERRGAPRADLARGAARGARGCGR